LDRRSAPNADRRTDHHGRPVALNDDLPTEVQALIAELETARAEVERLFARWQEPDAIKETSPR
jgi:hypothetical protein